MLVSISPYLLGKAVALSLICKYPLERSGSYVEERILSGIGGRRTGEGYVVAILFP